MRTGPAPARGNLTRKAPKGYMVATVADMLAGKIVLDV
jgi:hypothetical protein